MGLTELIFVDPGMKVNGQYYHDAASDQACCRRYILSFNKTTLHLVVPGTPLNCYSKKRWTSLVLISGHQTAQTWFQWIMSRDCMNVVWTVSMSWSSASLNSGTVCSRTLLTRPSTSGESDWEHACVQMDNILNSYCERIWLTKVTDKYNVSNLVYSQKRRSFTTELMIFRVLKFPNVRCVQ